MPLRRLLPVVLLVLSVPALVLPQTGQSGGSEGERDLALGLAAYAGQRYEEAVEHLSQAIGELSRGESRAALAEAYLRLGMTYLVGLESPGQALPAFLRSAELGTEPATAYLWASLAARKLGDAGAAERLETQALAAGPARPATIEERAETPEAAPAAQPDAFGYFFRGEKEETTGAAVAPARQPAREPARPGQGTAVEKNAEKKKKEGQGDAFQYFFGKKKPEPEAAAEKPPSEPPPAECPLRLAPPGFDANSWG